MGDPKDYRVLVIHPSCRQTKTIRKSRTHCVNCGALLKWDRYGGYCPENQMGHPKGGDWIEVRKEEK
jgi:hypothetical protein